MKIKALTTKEIVLELNRYIVGQDDAKKAVSIALRNRWRRKNLDEKMREEVVPKNILMVGPTGVGKTEIARRLAKLANAPFVKVEATKFTEVGYVGRDVDSIIRDLVDNGLLMVRQEKHKAVEKKAEEAVTERLLDSLTGTTSTPSTRQKFQEMLEKGDLEDKEIEIEVIDTSSNNIMSNFEGPGIQMGLINIGDMLNKVIGGERTKLKKLKVHEARRILLLEESDKLIDNEKIIKEALDLAQEDGIVFLDEIDKIATRNDARGGEVSREGVQRDLLPLLEGTTVSTKHGTVKTDHILFIASGAFHIAKPADLLPELQGRLPIRVELSALTNEDMIRILQEPEYSLLKQYKALLKTEEVEVEFVSSGIEKIAALATQINNDVENIGARRLHTILEKLLEDISYNASDMRGVKVVIDEKYVDDQLSSLTKHMDLSKFIL